MIGRLRGQLVERSVQHVILDVNGVGYLVHVTPHVSTPINETLALYIHTAVRDDAITLYGFEQKEEQELFLLLIGVPGVGPAKAMGILQTPVSVFMDMVRSRSAAQLAKLPGIGKKTAERMLVDLADKISALSHSPNTTDSVKKKGAARAPLTSVLDDMVSALVNLGFKESVAMETAQASIAELGEEAGLDVLIRDALARSRPKI